MSQKFKFLYLIPVLLLVGLIVLQNTKKQAFRSTTAANGCVADNLLGELSPLETLAISNGNELKVPTQLASNTRSPVLGLASPEEKWIEIDLSDQTLKAWNGNELYLQTRISTGLPFTPTPTGEFRIWIKLRATKMEGGVGRNYYYLPNVPYVMYFHNESVPAYRGYGLHGTYWHNDFGNQRSHGCVNLPTPIAEKLYYWTSPVLSEGKGVVFANDQNQGTRIVIHE